MKKIWTIIFVCKIMVQILVSLDKTIMKTMDQNVLFQYHGPCSRHSRDAACLQRCKPGRRLPSKVQTWTLPAFKGANLDAVSAGSGNCRHPVTLPIRNSPPTGGSARQEHSLRQAPESGRRSCRCAFPGRRCAGGQRPGCSEREYPRNHS